MAILRSAGRSLPVARGTERGEDRGAVCASHNANYNFSEAVETPTMLIKIDMQIACAREGECLCEEGEKVEPSSYERRKYGSEKSLLVGDREFPVKTNPSPFALGKDSRHFNPPLSC